MRTIRIARLTGLFLLMTTSSIVANAVLAAADPEGDALEGKLHFVQTLVERSSAAKHVAVSRNKEAKARHRQARGSYEKALVAHRAGDDKGARVALHAAIRAMMEAVQMAGAQVSTADQRREFQDRLESVNTLLEAHERIGNEKGTRVAGAKLRQATASKIAQAKALFEKGRLEKARAVLDEAYAMVKVAVRGQREGETLVRSLHFASKEDEYRYELDRNESHRMLVTLLFKEHSRGAGAQGNVEHFLGTAADLRTKAERRAAGKDFKAAVDALEQSTAQLMRALRGAGINIPG